MAELDRISDELAAATLAPLDAEQRARLLEAQAEVRRLLAISMIGIAPEDPASADARWCLSHYFAELAERFEEPFDPARTLPTGAEDLFLRRRASAASRPAAGCSRRSTPGPARSCACGSTARIAASGSPPACSTPSNEHASARGHDSVRLYTNRSLAEAKAMYRARGYEEIARYNDDPYANHWFEKRLSSSEHRTRLTASSARATAATARSIRTTRRSASSQTQGRSESACRTCGPSDSAGSPAPCRTPASGGRPTRRGAARRGRR